MKYFIDTEFWEQSGSIELISIGIVAEDGRTLYLENEEFQWKDCTSEWLHINVKPHLSGDFALATPSEIRKEIRALVSADRPEFWGYFADYDWVVFCWIFGSMMDLPKGWPMFCLDIKQWAYMIGNPRLPPQTSTAHNALNDAIWTKEAWEYLKGIHS